MSSGTPRKKQFPSRTFTWVACSLLTLGLAAQPALAAPFSTGFEAGEGYTGTAGGTLLSGQNLWTGGPFDVHTYSGSQITHAPAGGGIYSAPINPNGGDQFIAQGTTFSSDVFNTTFSGVVEISADYAPGPQFDNNGNFNGAMLARADGLRLAGYYSGNGSAAPAGNPSPGPWAPHFRAFDAAGNDLANIDQGYRFDGLAGFDNLDMEQWYRIGVVVNVDTRQIIQIKSQKLVAGANVIVVSNPQIDGADFYMEGGSAGADVLDNLRFYNSGSGTLSMFDNAYVGDPYEWQVIQPFAITAIDYDPDADTVTLTWHSRSGKTYSAFSSLDLSDWSNELAHSLGAADDEIPDDGAHITVTFPLTDGLENATDLCFRIQEE